MKKEILYLASIIFVFCLIAQDVKIPELESRVTDLTNTLSQSEINTLEGKLRKLEEEKGSQVAVLIVPTTGDEAIEQYSIRVAEKWKIGRGEVDDGVIFLVAMEDREMRIEVGYGLEGAIPDAIAKRIITNIVTPEFRSGHFYQGINDGLDAILAGVRGEELPPAVKQTSASGGREVSFILPFLIFGFFVFGIINAILKRKLGGKKSKLITSAIIFVLGWLIVGFFISIVLSFIISLFSIASTRSSRGRRRGGFYGGYIGGGGGFSGGGGGFGGFSGGGGGFGGGGASGGW